MTMMSTQFGLDDMEALLCGPSSLMADPMGSLLHQDKVTSIEGGASSLSSSSSSPLPFLSPPPSPPSLLLQEEKAEADLLSFPWLSADEQGHTHHIVAVDGKEDAFSGMDWMAERVDLSEFDLDSLIGSCSPDGSPSAPEDLIASFECPMELDSLPLPTLTDLPTTTDPLLPLTVSEPQEDPQEEVHSPHPFVPDAQEKLEIKSEPQSPAPSLPSPTFTLDLGSEVDVSANVSEKLRLLDVSQPVPSIVLPFFKTRIVLLLAPKQEVGVTTTTVTIPEIFSSDSDRSFSSSSQLNRPSMATAPSRSQTRSKLYPTTPKSRPQHPDHPSPTTTSSGKLKSSTGGPPKEKLKKMAQNKTAATRYRQKKKNEQEVLSAECDELEQRNHKLVEKADSIANEIRYLKDLMEEVRHAKSRRASVTSNRNV
ncbi:unnamed protein product [Coregonus sp. 'balchen']|nr:unnamed protein product [Coregonus sp. 'balchen']